MRVVPAGAVRKIQFLRVEMVGVDVKELQQVVALLRRHRVIRDAVDNSDGAPLPYAGGFRQSLRRQNVIQVNTSSILGEDPREILDWPGHIRRHLRSEPWAENALERRNDTRMQDIVRIEDCGIEPSSRDLWLQPYSVGHRKATLRETEEPHLVGRKVTTEKTFGVMYSVIPRPENVQVVVPSPACPTMS